MKREEFNKTLVGRFLLADLIDKKKLKELKNERQVQDIPKSHD